MLDSLPFVLVVATALGFLSGLGIGGGSLLILWLTTVLGMNPYTARSINLLFFIPSALVAIGFRIKQGRFQIKPLLPAVIAGCVAAMVFSLVSTTVHTETIKRLFGFVLLAAGARELLYKPGKKGSSK